MKLTPIRGKEDALIRELFDNVIASEPDEVIVFFFRKDEYFIRSNGTFSKVRLIGALEAMKYELLSTESPT